MLIEPSMLAIFNVVPEPGEAATVDHLIASASSAITSAAGVPIIAATSTIEVLGMNEQFLNLPGAPVRRIDEVRLEGVVLDASTYKRDSTGIYRAQGWACGRDLPIVEVTYFHGFDEVPADIQTLCASMVIAGLYAAREGGWELQNGRTSSIAIDDYREGLATSGEGLEQVTPMDLPERARKSLRARFGGSAVVVNTA